MPGNSGNNYVEPDLIELETWAAVILAIESKDIDLARTLASSINYQIIAFTDTVYTSKPLYYVLEESLPRSNYWGSFIFADDACRNLTLQAPHPLYDFNTGKQAIFCFCRLGAKALFLSGAHRCNHSASSICDGSTSVCMGVDAAFQLSDMAHNTQSTFQQATESLLELYPTMNFVQLHGFGKDADDPYLIMSNGTRNTPANDFIISLRDELLLQDTDLTFKIAHIDLDWDELLAFTNVQGRHINGSPSACDTPADGTNGQFIHIEQELSKLRADSIGWHKIYSALRQTFSCTTALINEHESNIRQIKLFPNPSLNGKFRITGAKANSIAVTDIKGNIIFQQILSPDSDFEINLESHTKGIYFVLITEQSNIQRFKLVMQ